MSIANQPDVNGNITISSSCVKCAGGPSDPSANADYGSADLSGKVEVVFTYNANRSDQGAFGFGRTCSVNLYLQLVGSTVTLTRGNGNEAKYGDDGTGHFVAQTVGIFNTLTRDAANGLWKESTPDGRVMAYPIVDSGQVSRIAWAEDSVGNRHLFAYDATGVLQSVQDAFGRKTTFSYGNNLLGSLTDFAGRVTRFTYESTLVSQVIRPDGTTAKSKTLLTQVTGPTGCQTRYEYDSQGHLTAVVDPNGFRTGYTYDAQGRVVQRAVAGVGNDTYSYQADRTTWTDALGRTTTYIVDVNSKLAGTVDATGGQSSITRNVQGLSTQVQDPIGATWQSAYDARGNVISTMDPLGNVTRTDRDLYGNPISITYPGGAVEKMVWGMGSTGYDTTGSKRRMQAFTDALGNTTTYAYNAYGQLTSVRDALGNVSSRDYDSVGNLIRTTDALGKSTQFAYDAAGNQISQTDALGAVWRYTYDAADRLLSITDPLNNVTQFAYDAGGNQVARVDALGNRTSTTYNAFDLPVSQTDVLGNVTTYEYDAVGQPTALVDALSNRSTTQCNATGQITSAVDGLGNHTIYQYDTSGRLVAVVDGLGNRSIYQYDAIGRRIGLMNALGYQVSVEHDVRGRQTAIIDAKGNRTTQVYNARGDLLQRVDALGAVESFGYDAVGNQVKHTIARGRTTSSTYDAVGRLLLQVLPDGTRITQTYDAVGQLLSVQDATGTTSYAYDAVRRLVRNTNERGNVLTYEYDALGNRTALIDPEGGRTTYAYEAGRRLTHLVSPRGEATAYSYDALGHETRKVLPNNATVQHTYDAAGRETLLEHRTAQGALISRFAYTYNAVSNKQQVTELDGSVVSYGYDPAYQLIKEQRTGTNAYNIGYSYDAVGNRLSTTQNGVTTTSTYNAVNQLVQQQSPGGQVTTWSYDADGNLTNQSQVGGNSTLYSFDDLDHLRAVEVRAIGGTPQNRSEFVYDAMSRLAVSKNLVWQGSAWVQTSQKGQVYDGLDSVQERDASNAVVTNLVRDGNIGGIVARSSASGKSYFHYDGSGNVTALSDETGALVGHYSYDGFGNTFEATGAKAQENSFRFSTKELDAISGLYIYGYRFYSPGIGRWINRDLIRERGGLNLYSFVGNSPLNRSDAYGLDDKHGWKGGAVENGSKTPIEVLFDTKNPTRVVWRMMVPPGWMTDPFHADVDYARNYGDDHIKWFHLKPWILSNISDPLAMGNSSIGDYYTDRSGNTRLRVTGAVPCYLNRPPSWLDKARGGNMLMASYQSVDPVTGLPSTMLGTPPSPLRVMPFVQAVKGGYITPIRSVDSDSGVVEDIIGILEGNG